MTGEPSLDKSAAIPFVDRQRLAWMELPKDLVAGAVMGGVAHSIVAPIERVKLLLQTQESNMELMGRGNVRKYKGMLDALIRITREEGMLSLWRGNTSSVMRYYPSLALNFAFKDFYRAHFSPAYSAVTAGDSSSGSNSGSNFWAFARGNFLAGAAAGVTALAVVYPLDLAHTRLAADVGTHSQRQFHGMHSVLKTIYVREGIRGWYKGLPASIQGMVVHRSIYFGGFDTAKGALQHWRYAEGGQGQDTQQQQQQPQRLPFWQRWVVAQAATTTAGLVSYPLDTVRHRMMMQAGFPEEKRQYRNTWECWRRIYQQEGVLAFYRGAFSNMVRGTGGALLLVLYDEVRHLFDNSTPVQ